MLGITTFLYRGIIERLLEISNNQVENAIRLFVVGRKGWLFADTPQGAEASAIIYSLMETAKANSLRLDDYLNCAPKNGLLATRKRTHIGSRNNFTVLRR